MNDFAWLAHFAAAKALYTLSRCVHPPEGFYDIRNFIGISYIIKNSGYRIKFLSRIRSLVIMYYELYYKSTFPVVSPLIT